MFSEPKFWEAMRNNMLWLIVVPATSTAFGLLVAQLTDRIGWGNVAKSIIFMPMAISFVGASVIFKLIYDTRPEDRHRSACLNAVWMQFEGGFGSILFLKILPISCCSFRRPSVAYVGYIMSRMTGRAVADCFSRIAALRSSVFAAWMVFLSLALGAIRQSPLPICPMANRRTG